MTPINPNNWHYTVDSGSHGGDVVVPLDVSDRGLIRCAVMYVCGGTSHIGDHVLLDPEILTRLPDDGFGKYGLAVPSLTLERTVDQRVW